MRKRHATFAHRALSAALCSATIGIIAAFATTGCSTGAKSGSSSGLFRSKSDYSLRPFEEKTLENGLKIIFIPDETLPYVTYSLMVKAGAAQDPEAQSGISSFVAEMLDKGTRKRSATQIADELGKLGADFDASASEDYSLVTVSGLSMHGEVLLGNMIELVTEPAFTDSEIERTRKNIVAQLARRPDNPDAMADVAWESYLYGSHPYASPVSGVLKDVKEIKKKNLIQHYLRYYRPNNSTLAVVGQYTPALRARIEKEFEGWTKRDVPEIHFPKAEPVKGIEIRIADKPGLVQSQIRMGQFGIKRQNEDFLALRVANTILGGAFSSRLVNRVRKELGLTYSISSVFEARRDPGPFTIETFTKNETVGQTLTEVLKTVSDFTAGGVSRDEVEAAKGYLKGVFPTAIETPEKLAFNLLMLRLHGIPDTYLTNYLNDVDRLSVSDVNRVIRKYIDPRNMKILVYTSAPAVAPQLEAIGKVEIKKALDMQ